MTNHCICLMHVWQRPCFNQVSKLLLNLINLLTSLWQCLHETNCEHMRYCFSSVSQGFIYYLWNALKYLDVHERLLQSWHNWCKEECWDVFDYLTQKGKERISRAFFWCEFGLEYQDEWFWIFFFIYTLNISPVYLQILDDEYKPTTLSCFSLLPFTDSFSSWVHRGMQGTYWKHWPKWFLADDFMPCS